MTVTVDPNTLAIVGVITVLVGPYLKSLIDIIRIGVDLPRPAPVLIAVGGGYVLSLLVLEISSTMSGSPIPLPLALAISVFVTIVVASQAVGITTLHDHANDVVGARRERKATRVARPGAAQHQTAVPKD